MGFETEDSARGGAGRAPSKRGPYRTGIRRREQVIEAAIEVFGTYGYAASSLRMIAEKVGVTPVALISLFGSKEALLSAVLDRWDSVTKGLSLNASPGIIGFVRYVEVERFHMQHRGFLSLFLIMTIEGSAPDHPAHAWVRDRYGRLIEEGLRALRETKARGEITLPDDSMVDELRGLYALMDGIAIQWMIDQTQDLSELFRPHLRAALARWGADAKVIDIV